MWNYGHAELVMIISLYRSQSPRYPCPAERVVRLVKGDEDCGNDLWERVRGLKEKIEAYV